MRSNTRVLHESVQLNIRDKTTETLHDILQLKVEKHKPSQFAHDHVLTSVTVSNRNKTC